jgi:hypothetical protein
MSIFMNFTQHEKVMLCLLSFENSIATVGLSYPPNNPAGAD